MTLLSFLVVYGLVLFLFARSLLPYDPLRRLFLPRDRLVTPRAVLVLRVAGVFFLIVGLVEAARLLLETRE